MGLPLLFLPFLSPFLVLALMFAKPRCEMLEFPKGRKKPAEEKRQVVFWWVGELNRLTAGFGEGRGRGTAGLHGRSGSWGKASRAASLTPTLQPVPGLGLHHPLWYVPCLPCLSPGTSGELPAASPFHLVLVAPQPPGSAQLPGPTQPSGAHFLCSNHAPGHDHWVLLPAEPP